MCSRPRALQTRLANARSAQSTIVAIGIRMHPPSANSGPTDHCNHPRFSHLGAVKPCSFSLSSPKPRAAISPKRHHRERGRYFVIHSFTTHQHVHSHLGAFCFSMRPHYHTIAASVSASVSASMHAARAAFSTALICAALTALGPPVHAAYLEQDFLEATGRLQRSIGSLAASSHIVLAAQTADTLPPYASALVDIALSTDTAELKKLVERAVDVALSVPPDAVAAAKGEVKEAFSGLKPGSCELVPLPMATFDRLLASEAVSSASRIRELSEQWATTLEQIPHTDAGVCLPPPERLEKLLGVQTDAFAAADKAKVRELELQSARTLGTVQKGERFRLFSQLGKRQLETLSRANFVARDQFKKASAEYLEARRFVEELKQKRADGPPQCFTIGCTVFYENDVRRCFGSRVLARACCLAMPLPRRCLDPSLALTPPAVRVSLPCAPRSGATTTRTTLLERALRSPTAS